MRAQLALRHLALPQALLLQRRAVPTLVSQLHRRVLLHIHAFITEPRPLVHHTSRTIVTMSARALGTGSARNASTNHTAYLVARLRPIGERALAVLLRARRRAGAGVRLRPSGGRVGLIRHADHVACLDNPDAFKLCAYSGTSACVPQRTQSTPKPR